MNIDVSNSFMRKEGVSGVASFIPIDEPLQ